MVNAPSSLVPEEWAEAFSEATGNLIDKVDVALWFEAAIQAGYDKARPLDPEIIYLNDQMIAEKTVFP